MPCGIHVCRIGLATSEARVIRTCCRESRGDIPFIEWPLLGFWQSALLSASRASREKPECWSAAGVAWRAVLGATAAVKVLVEPESKQTCSHF